MTKICERCLEKYDDVHKVCLLCGDKLVSVEEECTPICRMEGLDVGDMIVSRRARAVLIFIIALLLLVFGVILMIVRHNQDVERLERMRGTYVYMKDKG